MDVKRWQKFSLAEQMGNIGSEISRADSFEKKQDLAQRTKSLERTLEMIDSTIADPANYIPYADSIGQSSAAQPTAGVTQYLS